MSTSTGRLTLTEAPDQGRSNRVCFLLSCGAVAGPLFLTTVLVQESTRDGFDPSRHPLSALSLGDLGWIQTTNFVVTGLLAAAGAVGARRVLGFGRARTWGPRLLGVYGLALVAAAAFATDRPSGFPPASTSPGNPSWHGQAHDTAALVSGLALDAASIVFARWFLGRGQHAWARYSIAAVAADFSASGAAAATGDFRWLLLGGAVTWTWASALPVELLHQHDTRCHQPTSQRLEVAPVNASGSELEVHDAAIRNRPSGSSRLSRRSKGPAAWL